MLEFLVDNIFVFFGGKVFQQIVGIPMGANCAPLLADIFLYSYEAEFMQSLLSTGKKKFASQFNFTYRYIDDVLSINNQVFENYLGQMYPAELEIKDTTESNTSASYLDLLLSTETGGRLRTSLHHRRDDFNFHITNFPFLSSNIPSSPVYGVFISKVIRYATTCSSYECFCECHCCWTKESPRAHVAKFYGRFRLICSILSASKFSVLKLIEIVILWVYYTIPFGLSFFRHFWGIIVQLFKLLSLAKDHRRGFNTRNAHMVYIDRNAHMVYIVN